MNNQPNETYRPSKPFLEAIALWLTAHDLTEPDMAVKRDDLAIGLLEMGIITGMKRKVIRNVRATRIPESFSMMETAHYALMITFVCPTSATWDVTFRAWFEQHRELLLSKGAVAV